MGIVVIVANFVAADKLARFRAHNLRLPVRNPLRPDVLNVKKPLLAEARTIRGHVRKIT